MCHSILFNGLVGIGSGDTTDSGLFRPSSTPPSPAATMSHEDLPAKELQPFQVRIGQYDNSAVVGICQYRTQSMTLEVTESCSFLYEIVDD
jgi:hypothetical protein